MLKKSFIVQTFAGLALAFTYQPLANFLQWTSSEDRQGLAVTLILIWLLTIIFWPRSTSSQQSH